MLKLKDARDAQYNADRYFIVSFTAKRSLVDGKYDYVTLARQLMYHCEARVVTGLSATVYERAKIPPSYTRIPNARLECDFDAFAIICNIF